MLAYIISMQCFPTQATHPPQTTNPPLTSRSHQHPCAPIPTTKLWPSRPCPTQLHGDSQPGLAFSCSWTLWFLLASKFYPSPRLLDLLALLLLSLVPAMLHINSLPAFSYIYMYSYTINLLYYI